ncbi:MAG: xylulokinase [Planctomycetes bacterium]|nr:xylulokinase [Planctomycetota bacterium]
MRLTLGIDLGTSGCKCAVLDERLVIRDAQTVHYRQPPYSEKPGWYEHDAELWWDGVARCVAAITARLGGGAEIGCIGLSGQMHGLVALDRDRRVIRPAIISIDSRNEAQCRRIYQLAGGYEGVYRYTNNRMIPSATAAKLLWMKDNEPALFNRIETVVNPKDYIRLRLTGEIATDVSDASGTGVFDVKHRRWNEEFIRLIGLSPELFPPALESTAVAGALLPGAAEAMGVKPGIPVVAGGGDAIIQTIATGALEHGVYGIGLGTGSVIGASLDAFHQNDDTLQIYCSCIPGRYLAYSGMLSAGTALDWLRDILFAGEADVAGRLGCSAYNLIDAEAGQAPPGSDNLLFYPMLIGQRSPVEDAFAKGAFLGLTPHHDKRHLARALMEGVVYGMRDISRLFENMHGPVRRIHTIAGGAASTLWCQIMADVFNAEVVRPENYLQGGCVGAAMVAGVGAGVFPSIEEAAARCAIGSRFEPVREHVEKYREMMEIYRRVYPSNAEIFHML